MFVSSNYGWENLHLGLAISLFGLIGVIFLMSFSWILKVVRDIDLVIYGILAMAISCLLLVQLSPSHLVPQYLFYIAMSLMFSTGYPIGHTALLGVYSKIVKVGPQGRILSIFGAVGSIARIVLPLLAGTTAQYLGYNAIFITAAIFLILASSTLFFYRYTVDSIIN